MNSVQETPLKRRKLDSGDVAKGDAYDSQDDSGDEIFDDFETVATLPLAHTNIEKTDLLSTPSRYITQPTQLIDPATPGSQHRPSVQVAASSPAREMNIASPTPTLTIPGGRLASSMAPAGTAFRAPPGIAKAPIPVRNSPQVNEISSDEDLPTYKGSSDEESQNREADIKPSEFITSAQRSFSSGGAVGNSFKKIMSSSVYQPHVAQMTSGPTSSADTMANAYGSARRAQPPKQVRQTGPSKNTPPRDIDIIEIEDFNVRSKIIRMRDILPRHSVLACKRAMEKKKYNFDDAIEFLAASEDNPTQIDLTISEGEDPLSSQAPKKASAKQQLKAPVKKIQDKWKTNQPTAKVNLHSSPPVTPPKPKRRLVQGRRQASTPVKAPSPRVASPILARDATPVDDSDSALGLSDVEVTDLEAKVLNFFNICSPLDLADIASITEEVAIAMLFQKPFGSLDVVRQFSGDVPLATGKGKTSSKKKPVGDKIVEKCLDMWAGYEAVDLLVKRCDELAEPLREDMNSWGVDVLGAVKGGELDLVSFDRDNSPRDSGIGTPSTNVSEDEGDVKVLRKRGFLPQPSIMAEGVILKDYQIVGVNWLSLLYQRKLSCILADDMGLGKTCQVIAFLAHLLEKGIKGPHLVVVPASTLENWLREFSIFCPNLRVMPYYADQKERQGIQQEILDTLENLNVIVTTYTLAKTKEDNKFFRKLRPVVCVYDEGHILKNRKSAAWGALMKIPSSFRLLLTGTPLQNNLSELASLLGFILPQVFEEHSEALEAIFSHKARTTDDSHAALLSTQRIKRAKSMMAPFVLRRKKHQVLRHLPPKTRKVEYCQLSPSQSEIYGKFKAKALRVAAARAAGEKVGNETSHVLMELRKASIHSLLFRRLYNDDTIRKMSKACLKEEEFCQSNPNLVFEDMEVMTDMELYRFCEKYSKTMGKFLLEGEPWMESGKIDRLSSLLQTFRANGDRTLVFSQFTMVLNILESVLETLGISFFRLDGSTAVNERQAMIDQFYKEEHINVFLLSTGAGGAGINLACANKVIIFDSAFNPQQDIQAENRAHRVGQTREVEVVRLLTKDTIEEQIHALGETKLALDDRVAGVVEDDPEGKKAEKQSAKMMEEIMIRRLEEEANVGAKRSMDEIV
ncbi:hypothetical protein MMC21_000275 [Puttea exsequens]|nr:hypothetical protein [Puttea exsequens]